MVPAWRVDRTFTYLVPEELESSVAAGSLVRIPFGHRKVRGIVASVGEGDGAGLGEILKLVVEPPVAPPPMVDVLEWMAERYATPRGVVYDRVVPPRIRVKPAVVPIDVPDGGASLLPLYEGGAELLAAIANGGSGVWTIQALPVHDRAELIGELVGTALALDEGAALVAVPEVRYGSSVLEGLAARFPGCQRVDSAVGDSTRSKGALSLAAGTRLGAGGPYSVLAPAPKLRLIVVDEEPNRAYKEDRSPRFDARLVAIERARRSGAVCVLIATAPSIRAGWMAAERGGWVGPSRADSKAARPNVEIAEPPDEGGLSHHLHRAVNDTLGKGQAVGLLVPQSGYSRSLWCASCRHSVRCKVCEAGMIFDRERRAVRCPRCGATEAAPDVCPRCSSTDLKFVGAGSERLRDQLAKSFPRAKVMRVDPFVLSQGRPDVTGADIYVTTWIGTKEALRPNVKLVGILNADTLIRRADLRATESAYQAFAEMAEWAGPFAEGGRLVIQTNEPGHHSIQAVVRADYRFFLNSEVEFRRELGYPPFSELIKVRAGGPEGDALLERAGDAARAERAQVLGPIAVKASDGEAQELLLKCPDAGKVARGLRVILPEVPQGSYLRVDVDPR